MKIYYRYELLDISILLSISLPRNWCGAGCNFLLEWLGGEKVKAILVLSKNSAEIVTNSDICKKISDFIFPKIWLSFGEDYRSRLTL